MLYRPEAFERLTDEAWDDARARDGIRDIVAETEASFRGPTRFWQAHEWDRWQATSPMKNLYVGTAGTLYALDDLRRRGLGETRLDLGVLARRNLDVFRERPDFMKTERFELRESSLLCGETGILLVAWKLAPSDDLADDLLSRVRANIDNPADELMWGAPGTLVAAHLMHTWTDDERWREASRETAEALWSRRDGDGLWTQAMWGRKARLLTPPHGLVGNAQALAPVLDDARRRRLERETAAVLSRAAIVEDGLANWPPFERPELPGPDGQIRLQWCVGAPGIVIAARDYLDEDLLLAGAELVWQAGPHGLEKGASICHGTAGNGYAFMKAFERTGDEHWLERARRFAVHALGQVERLRAERGRGRHSLWTGDLGVALYVADCLEARGAYPIFEAT